MLDDVRMLYYNGETKTLHPRGNTTAEDDVFDSDVLLTISDYMRSSFINKWEVATKNLNKTDGKHYTRLYALIKILNTINYYYCY